MKASELKVGEACRHNNMGCTRVELPHYVICGLPNAGMVALVNSEFQLYLVESDEEVRQHAFGFIVQKMTELIGIYK